jgi:hypothetical protein
VQEAAKCNNPPSPQKILKKKRKRKRKIEKEGEKLSCHRNV